MLDTPLVSLTKKDNRPIKKLKSKTHNYIFYLDDGTLIRWGEKYEDNPVVGYPEIADIEVSEICNQGCKFCYKSNGASGLNMSLDLYTQILSSLPCTITQVALGIGDLDGNPELKDIISYSRDRLVIPNLTINGAGLTEDWVSFLSANLGAIAVSLYDKDVCFEAVQRLTAAGMKQVNIHAMLSEETFESCMDAVKSVETDPRLKDLRALVFLSLKQKGRGEKYHRVSDEHFEMLIKELRSKKISYGFDSCTANKVIACYEKFYSDELKGLKVYAEPCEASLFSTYINVKGEYSPCSFCEETQISIPIVGADFMKDVWFNPEVVAFRENLLACKRSCPVYAV